MSVLYGLFYFFFVIYYIIITFYLFLLPLIHVNLIPDFNTDSCTSVNLTMYTMYELAFVPLTNK